MVESDRDRLLAHDVDGIREYDNPLPGWWVGLFWATILFCLPYVCWYHYGEGLSPHGEYESEVAAFAEQLLATYGKLEPDAATILRFKTDPVAMAGMASLFRAKCAQCHRADGSGMVGPNLTDAHWINVKKTTDVFKVLSDGVPLKGMPTWRDQLTETQRVLLSAYVVTLREHPVAGKEPQGEIIGPFGLEAGAGP